MLPTLLLTPLIRNKVSLLKVIVVEEEEAIVATEEKELTTKEEVADTTLRIQMRRRVSTVISQTM
jgi:hypothetical protein